MPILAVRGDAQSGWAAGGPTWRPPPPPGRSFAARPALWATDAYRKPNVNGTRGASRYVPDRTASKSRLRAASKGNAGASRTTCLTGTGVTPRAQVCSLAGRSPAVPEVLLPSAPARPCRQFRTSKRRPAGVHRIPWTRSVGRSVSFHVPGCVRAPARSTRVSTESPRQQAGRPSH